MPIHNTLSSNFRRGTEKGMNLKADMRCRNCSRKCRKLYRPIKRERRVGRCLTRFAIGGRETLVVGGMPLLEYQEKRRRDNAWLQARQELLWEIHFSDVAKGYPIETRFGTRAQYRFGSIAARNGKTIILINQLFADPFVPDYVVDGTLGHELAHYAHGYGSGLPKIHADPHRGGVVDLEMEKRGLGEVNRKADQWREKHWDAFYAAQCKDIVERRSARSEDADTLWRQRLMLPHARTIAEVQQQLCRLQARVLRGDASLPVFEVEWLKATSRQSGTSYYYDKQKVLRLHGLLSDKRVPIEVIEFELAYWLMRCCVGASWQSIYAALCAADLSEITETAIRWRKAAWTGFRNRNHPLKK